MPGLLLLLVSAPSCKAEPLSVEGFGLRLTVDAATGDLLSLVGTRRGEEYLAERRGPMFQVQLAHPDGRTEWKDSRAARAVELTGRSATELTLCFREIADGLDATVTLRGREATGVSFRIELENRGAVIVEPVVFPLLHVKRPLGDSAEDDRLFVPGGDGYVAGPEAMERQRWQRRGYPGHASMQFTAYYDGTQGLATICRDAEGQPKLLGASIGDDFVDLSTWFRRPAVRETDYRSPWVQAWPTQHSWTGAASCYREWAREQWWAKPKRGEAATPEWVRDSPVVLSADFRPLGNGRMFVPLERATEFAREWQAALGAANVMVEWRNWERHGYYTSPAYFPLYPRPGKVTAVLGGLREAGYHSQAMVAGLKWMVQREAYHTPHYSVTAYDGRELFEREGRAACVIGRDGQVQVDKAYFTWDGEHAYLCPATEYAQEHFRTCARTLAQAGFDLFEFDQMNGGSCPPCYSREHGHPPGEGLWIRKAVAELMRITREEGRLHSRDFAISMEDPGELYLPELDTYISRANDVIGWPAVGPGSEVVPAFFCVYGDLMPSTNVDIQHTCRPDALVLLRTARAFITGAGLSTQLTPWQVLADYGEDDLFPTPEKMDPDQLTLLRNCVGARDGVLRPYVRDGHMVVNRFLTAPNVSIRAHQQTGTQTEEVLIEAPAVLASVWWLPWRTLHVFVNHTTAPVEVRNALLEWTAYETAEYRVNGEPATGFSDRQFTVPALSVVTAEEIDEQAPWPLGTRFDPNERDDP